MAALNFPSFNECLAPKDIYSDGTYLKNNPNWHKAEAPWKAKEVIKAIKKNKLNPSSVCEVGCGSGEMLKLISEQLEGDIVFVGYDISPQAFEICSKKSKKNLSFILKDLTQDNEAAFDIVLVTDVVEHIEDYYGFLRNLKNKGRYKIFHIPLAFSVKGALYMSQIIKDRKLVGHIHCFSKETALASLEYTGYKILDYSYIGKRVDRKNLGWQSTLLKIPRKLFFSLNQDVAVRLLGGYSLSVVAE